MGKYVRVPQEKTGGVDLGPAAYDKEAEKKYPALVDNMTSRRSQDGCERQTLTILLFAERGRWGACLRDREAGQVCFVTALEMQGVLDAAEAVLATGEGDWRAEKVNSVVKARKTS